jgi:hypothetical protein
MKIKNIEQIKRAIKEATEQVIEDSETEIIDRGLRILDKVLQEGGFLQNEILKDYSVEAELSDNIFSFIINVEPEAFSDETMENLRSDRTGRVKRPETERQKAHKVAEKFLRRNLRTYRQPYMKDVRQKYHNALKPARSAIKSARDGRSDTEIRSTVKNASVRLREHAIMNVYPVGLDVEANGTLKPITQQVINSTNTRFLYPKNAYSGMVQKFMNSMIEYLEEHFFNALVKDIGRR